MYAHAHLIIASQETKAKSGISIPERERKEKMSHRVQVNILFLIISVLIIATIPRKYALRAVFSLVVSIFGVSVGFGAFPFLSL